MSDEQIQEHIRVMNQAIQILNREVVNLLYTQARMTESISFLMTCDDDTMRTFRKNLDDDFFVAQEIVSKDAKGK